MNTELYDEEMLGSAGDKRKEAILGYDQLKIYQHYVPSIQMGFQLSPFDSSDRRPGFSLYNADGRIRWKDHGSARVSTDIFDFVQQWYWTFKEKRLSFPETVDIIWYDMKLQPGQIVNTNIFFHSDEDYKIHKTSSLGKTHLDIKDTGWTSWAYSYWTDTYGIYPAMLEEYVVGHAKEVWYTKPGKPTLLWGVSTPDYPIYYFYFPHTGNVKVYAPFGVAGNKNKKWINNATNTYDVQGYYQLHIKQRRPLVVVFTKAMKECMFLRSFGIDGIAPHGESHQFTDDFIRHIRKYSTYQFSFYDSDWPGRRSAIMLQRRHGIDPFITSEAKNITDLWEHNPQALDRYADLFIKLKKTLWR